MHKAADFASMVDAKVVPGDSLIIDFVYFIHPVSLIWQHRHGQGGFFF